MAKSRKQCFEVPGIPCEQSSKTHGKGPNQKIGHRPSIHLACPLAKDVSVPAIKGRTGVSPSPALQIVHVDLTKEVFLSL